MEDLFAKAELILIRSDSSRWLHDAFGIVVQNPMSVYLPVITTQWKTFQPGALISSNK